MYSTSSPILRVDLLPEATLCEKALKHLMQSRVRLSCPGLLLAATYIHTNTTRSLRTLQIHVQTNKVYILRLQFQEYCNYEA